MIQRKRLGALFCARATKEIFMALRFAPRLVAILTGGTAISSLATVAAATTMQIGVAGVEVQQDILVTAVGDPSYYHESMGEGDPLPEGYLFFDEYLRVLTEEISPWDPAQIPSSPETATSNVISTGVLDGVWTFDASVLAQNLTGFTNPDGSLLTATPQSAVSTFEVTRGGTRVGGGVTTSTEIYVANNLLVGEEGETLDVIAIVAGRTPGFDFDPSMEGSSGVQLLVSGGSNWFEDAYDPISMTWNIPDFSKIVAGFVEYEEYVFGISSADGLTVPLYEEFITGSLTGSEIFVNDFGAADGSGEDAPLLPDVETSVLEDAEGNPLSNPIFGFNVAEATSVEIEGVDIVFIDPEIAVGYTYTLSGAGEVTGILAPSLAAVNDSDGYLIEVNGVTFAIDPGEYIAFADKGVFGAVTQLTLTGIDQSLMLDPLDGTTFVAGFSFMGQDSTTVFSQQAIVIDTDAVSPVPLPAGLPLLLTGFAALAGLARRRRAAA